MSRNFEFQLWLLTSFGAFSSRPVYEAGFDGYQQGVHLIYTEPTCMHSGSSDDSGGIDGEDLLEIPSPRDQVNHNHDLSPGSTPSTMGVSKFY